MRQQAPHGILSRVTASLLAASLTMTTLSPWAWAQENPAPASPEKPSDEAAEASPAKPATPEKPAKPPDPKTRKAARAAFDAAEAAYKKEDYETAYEKFKEANILIPSPQAAYWMAKSLDKLNRVEEAISAYELLLNDPNAAAAGEEKLTDAKARYEELKGSLQGVVQLNTSPPGASVSVNGEPQEGVTPMTLRLEPGTHQITLTYAGYEPKELEATLEPGAELEQTIELEQVQPEPEPQPAAPPPAPPPAPAPPPPPERSMVPAYVTLGIAGASAIVGGIFGVQALSAKSDFDDNPTSETADDVERNALIADMAFGVAITLGVTGIVLLTSDEPEPPLNETARTESRPVEKTRLEVSPYVGMTGGGATARVIF